jgi:predicted ArsR family transcriptional regulator
MGIRQHLLSLEKKGVVTYIAKKHGIGRPGFVYMLTPSADELFPKHYDRLALDILRDIKKSEGQEKVSKIYSWRKDRMLKQKRESLAGLSGTEEMLGGLKNLLEAEGYLVELDNDNDNYRLKTFNCPISKVATEFNEACMQELQMYRELLNRNVTMEQCMGQGSQSCVFSIPAA